MLAVVVVDVGGMEEVAGVLGFDGGSGGEVGVTGVEGQGEFGAIELLDESNEVEHVAAGVDSWGHVFDAEDDLGAGSVVGEGEERMGEGGAAGVEIVGSGEAAGVDDEASAGGFGEPVEAAFEVVDGVGLATGIDRGEIDACCLNRLAAPASVGAMDGEAGVADFAGEEFGVGKGAPIGEDFDDLSAEALGDFEVVGEAEGDEAVGDHCSEGSSGLAHDRHGGIILTPQWG